MVIGGPLEYAARRLFGGHRALTDVAHKTWVIEPESIETAPPAFCLRDTLARVTGADEFSSLEVQHKLIAGGEARHAGVVAYSLRGATILGHSAFCKGHRKLLGPGKKQVTVSDLVSREHYQRGVLGSTFMGNRFFGHFLVDDLPLMQLAAELGPVVRAARELPPHHADLLRLLDISPIPVRAATFDELIVVQDHGQTASKRRRFQALRTRMREAYAGDDAPYGVFIFRGTRGQSRVCENEEEIAAALVDRGFRLVRPESLSVEQVARQVQGARLVVGVEGSHLTHGLFNMVDDGAILALNPPWRFVNVFKNYTDCLGMHYGTVVGHETAAGFRIGLDEVLAVLDLIERSEPRGSSLRGA